MKNKRTNAIIRLIVMAVLMVNMVLTLAGKNPIPFDEAEPVSYTHLDVYKRQGRTWILDSCELPR